MRFQETSPEIAIAMELLLSFSALYSTNSGDLTMPRYFLLRRFHALFLVPALLGLIACACQSHAQSRQQGKIFVPIPPPLIRIRPFQV